MIIKIRWVNIDFFLFLGYGITFNRTEGLRIYQSLLVGGRNDPRDPNLPWGVTEAPIQPHHRQNSFWSDRTIRQMNGPSFDTTDVYARSPTTSRTTTHPTLIVRPSRVKQQSVLQTPQPVQLDQTYIHLPERHHTKKRKRNPSRKDIIKAELVSQFPTEGSSFAAEITPQEIQATVDKKDRSLPLRKVRQNKGRLFKKRWKDPMGHSKDFGVAHFIPLLRNKSNLILENEGK